MKIQKNIRIVVVVGLSAMLAPQFATCLAQGSLTPTGAPAPTMKTLDQIEARTPLSSFPVTITEPGSYYLTANGTVTGSAIHIQASNVTLDMNGFTLTGDGGETDYGILIDPTEQITNVSIANGKFVNFGGAVTTGSFGSDNLLVENIQMHTGTRTGVWIESNCKGAVLRNNLFVDCEDALDLVAFSGQTIRGVTIENNRVSGSPSVGVNINAQSGGTVRGVSVLNNQISGTTGTSILVSSTDSGGVQRLLIDSNHVTRDSAIGIIVPANAQATIIRNVFTGCTMSASTTGNTIGPIITTTGTLGTNGVAMSPWANFQN